MLKKVLVLLAFLALAVTPVMADGEKENPCNPCNPCAPAGD